MINLQTQHKPPGEKECGILKLHEPCCQKPPCRGGMPVASQTAPARPCKGRTLRPPSMMNLQTQHKPPGEKECGILKLHEPSCQKPPCKGGMSVASQTTPARPCKGRTLRPPSMINLQTQHKPPGEKECGILKLLEPSCQKPPCRGATRVEYRNKQSRPCRGRTPACRHPPLP